MAPSLDIITAITIAGILAILSLYVVVVYKKGWLKRELKESESYFLCPNAKCRRVFKDPIWLTDLSKTPPEGYQACPHCSTNLRTSPSFVAKDESSKLENMPKAAPPVSDFKKTPEPPADLPRESVPQKTEILKEVRSPATQNNVQSKQEKVPVPVFKSSPAPEIRTDTPPKHAESSKKPDEKRAGERPRSCSHYFGYVRTLPKNTSIPDECLWCPWIVDCLSGKQKVDA